MGKLLLFILALICWWIAGFTFALCMKHSVLMFIPIPLIFLFLGAAYADLETKLPEEQQVKTIQVFNSQKSLSK